MCMFTGSVHDVSKTVIFARPTDNGRQVLVYSMALTLSEDVAMVLPLPVPPAITTFFLATTARVRNWPISAVSAP